MEFKGVTNSATIFRKCSTENIKILCPIRDRDGKLIPDRAELEKFEGGKAEFSYGAKTIFKHTKRIIIEDCFPDRSKFYIKRQRIRSNGVPYIFGEAEREIVDISIERLSEAKKQLSTIFLRAKDADSNGMTWVFVLTLKPIV